LSADLPALDFRVLFEESPDILLALLPDAPTFTMVAATRARLAATHTTREQTIGRGLFELFPDNPDDEVATGTANLRASLERVVATRQPDTMAVQKYDIRREDGTFEVKYWSPKNVPVLSPSGELLYIFHRVEDVTDLVKASEQGEELRDRNLEMQREVIARSRELSAALGSLRDANTKLAAADAAKTVFFSNVSHELRTPLTLMLGPLTDALADQTEALGPKQRSRVFLAHESAVRLLKLVNALLDFSRLEAGRVDATFEPTNLAALTAEVAGMFDSAATRAGVGLTIDCASVETQAWVDRESYEKIVANLVSNALKYTLKGEITVRLSEEESSFVLEVADTGVGIEPAELPKVFERFYRAAGTIGRSREGTGIGLSLVRDLVLLHGGEVGATSAVGEGSTFCVRIPKGCTHLAKDAVRMTARRRSRGGAVPFTAEARLPVDPPEEVESATMPVDAARAKPLVLVVDDSPDLRRYMATLLSEIYTVQTASDGAEALEVIARRPPDVVVSDVMMPRLDGFELLKRLRADSKTESIPLILLSARAGEEAAIEGLDAGADDYLAKPFSSRELLARVRTHLALAKLRAGWSAKLLGAYQELDAFSYSVSHDLRTPLRAIQGFARLLAQDSADALDQQGRHYVDRIESGASKMSVLIDALLELAKVARVMPTIMDTDLSALAASVVSDLRQAEPDRRVDIQIAEGLAARGDQRLLRVALANLIGNAWKFTAKVEAPRIEVGSTDDKAFYVRDNGAGFDMQFAGRMFTPFQRMHASHEFDGTGIGLATVAKIVGRHGGRIWAESAPGAGATFFFTLTE
jgi:signal transduction histidine kinase